MSDIQLTIIVASAENNVIGSKNKMPWHLPNDFKYFKKNTLEHSVVMGRKTFESIGKPLPGRRNIVITRDQNWEADDVDVANSIQEVLTYCRDEREVFIIGGAEIYKQVLPLVSKILMTRVHTSLQGDAYFPELGDEWLLQTAERHSKDDKHAFDYTFEVWEKR